MVSNVKRCPFCGCDARVWTRVSFDRRVRRSIERTTVLCTACGCRTQAFEKPHEAISAWNQRCGRGQAMGGEMARGSGIWSWLARICRKILGV